MRRAQGPSQRPLASQQPRATLPHQACVPQLQCALRPVEAGRRMSFLMPRLLSRAADHCHRPPAHAPYPRVPRPQPPRPHPPCPPLRFPTPLHPSRVPAPAPLPYCVRRQTQLGQSLRCKPSGAEASPACHTPSSSASFPCSLAPPCTLRQRMRREQLQLQVLCCNRPAHLEPALPCHAASCPCSVPPLAAHPGQQQHGRYTNASRSYPHPPEHPRREASKPAPESPRERGGPCWRTKAWRRGEVSCLCAGAELRDGHKRAAVKRHYVLSINTHNHTRTYLQDTNTHTTHISTRT
jgi:hypothetical protein